MTQKFSKVAECFPKRTKFLATLVLLGGPPSYTIRHVIKVIYFSTRRKAGPGVLADSKPLRQFTTFVDCQSLGFWFRRASSSAFLKYSPSCNV